MRFNSGFKGLNALPMSAYIYIFEPNKKFLSNGPVGDQEGDRMVQRHALKNKIEGSRWIEIITYLVHQQSVISAVMNLQVSLVDSPYVRSKGFRSHVRNSLRNGRM